MTNPEWWEDKEYWETFAAGTNRFTRPNVGKIVAEAERRTWEEALHLIHEQQKTTDLTREGDVAWAELQVFETKVYIKLSSLTKK